MFYTTETRIAQLDYRINLMRQRGEQMNEHLINALIREKRNLENAKSHT